jgi:hypothetical protein
MIVESWSVIESKTGRVICQCSDETDAMMLVSFDPNNRTYSKQKYILDQVIDITSHTDKQLPGQIGLPPGTYKIEDRKIYKLEESDLQVIEI